MSMNPVKLAVANALASALPSTTTLSVNLADSAAAPAGTVGFLVDYVGPQTAELAVLLSERAVQAVRAAGGAGSFALVDVMRPAFEAATAQLGSGVLGEVSESSSAAHFKGVDTTVFELNDAGSGFDNQEPYAWVALKFRDSASQGAGGLSAAKLGRIHDVEMALSVVIGRTRMSVAHVLGLEPGQVVDLDRSAGSPADVLLNGRLIAHGEVVVVDQDYAVRITKILDTAETVG
ncbi:flagellar motor switch protein FliN [Arthrobacter antibioticus]|uniref:flagellar motor switch protein FliN n=1 Tax=Arthrobacter sp. H35-MC1 TaxID=3046203 RepID=UPI0024BA6A0B|nr:flagellar motor switch protein FliN [Arthrobacter sp. H35-MC1]MDJ0316657.1 flagellar motor switch protein FliN [Arthrobacter sp. H35-MC1]